MGGDFRLCEESGIRWKVKNEIVLKIGKFCTQKNRFFSNFGVQLLIGAVLETIKTLNCELDVTLHTILVQSVIKLIHSKIFQTYQINQRRTACF